MIKIESYGPRKLMGMPRHAVSSKAVSLVRQKNGMWTYQVEVDIRTKLPDGREVNVKKTVKVATRQEGRKPFPV